MRHWNTAMTIAALLAAAVFLFAYTGLMQLAELLPPGWPQAAVDVGVLVASGAVARLSGYAFARDILEATAAKVGADGAFTGACFATGVAAWLT